MKQCWKLAQVPVNTVMGPRGEWKSPESGWEHCCPTAWLCCSVWEELGETLRPGNNFISGCILETNCRLVRAPTGRPFHSSVQGSSMESSDKIAFPRLSRSPPAAAECPEVTGERKIYSRPHREKTCEKQNKNFPRSRYWLSPALSKTLVVCFREVLKHRNGKFGLCIWPAFAISVLTGLTPEASALTQVVATGFLLN